MLPTRVWNAEPVAAKNEVADLGMTQVGDPRPVTHISACPQFAESWAGSGQFIDHPIDRIAAELVAVLLLAVFKYPEKELFQGFVSNRSWVLSCVVTP